MGRCCNSALTASHSTHVSRMQRLFPSQHLDVSVGAWQLCEANKALVMAWAASHLAVSTILLQVQVHYCFPTTTQTLVDGIYCTKMLYQQGIPHTCCHSQWCLWDSMLRR